MNYSGLVIEEKYPKTMQRETAISESYIVAHKPGITLKHTQMDYVAVEKADTIMKAINHKLRQQIIKLLEEKRRVKVADIYQKLGLDQSAASLHLAILRRSNIVVTERSGRIIYYSLNYSRIAEVIDFMNNVISCKDGSK